MLAGGLNLIEVVSGGENAIVTLLGAGGQRAEAAPRFNDCILRQAGREDFIPTDHALVVLFENGDELLVEVGLQVGSDVQVVLLHEFKKTRKDLTLKVIIQDSVDVNRGKGEEGGKN